VNESPIFIKTDEMLAWLLGCTQKFPKSERFRMARRIEEPAFRFQELLQTSARKGDPDLLVDADVQLALLRRRLRLAHEMRLLSVGQLEHVARMVGEVGRLLGAWMKSTKR